MNGGTGSTLPVRNPAARPVSFHSLSEHNRKNPTYLSPYSHRRPRTPRSSPLAGPSLSTEEVDNENKDDDGSQKPKYRPNRISSTPDMVAPVQSLYDSDTASLQFPSSATSGGAPQNSNSSASSSSSEDDKEKELSKGKEEVEDGSRLRNFAKRLSIISTSSLTTNETDKDHSKAIKRRSLHSASTTSLSSTTSSSRTARTDQTNQTAPPIPTIPRWALNAMREEAGVANRNVKYGHRRGTSGDTATSPSLPPLPNQPIPRGVPLSASGLSNHPRPPSTSRDPRENWVSMTDPTPRFSRLALKGEGVVLPVSKKESLAKMKSSNSIKSTRSMTTITQSTTTRRDSGTTTRTEPSPGTGSNNPPNVTITEANLKEEGLRKRSSWAGSLKTRIPRISVSSSAHSENVPPLPSFANQSDSSPASSSSSRTSTSTSNESAKSSNTSVFPPMVLTSNTRKSTTSRRDSGLAVIDESRLPSPLPNDPEIGVRVGGVKSQDTQKTRARRKSIKQIVMRITTAPMSAGEKLKFGAIHKSNPVVVLPPDKLMPLDPPAATWVEKPASSSVPSPPSTTETPELACNQADARGSKKKFYGIKKKWNAVLATVRR